MSDISKLFSILAEHEHKFHRSFSLIPSENTISPVARLAFLSDGFSRYFFDEKEVFGRWSFQGGSIVGQIQQSILMPLLRRSGKAKYVDVHANSGLTGMTLALHAFGGRAGGSIISVAAQNGGHPDTRYVAERLGLVVHALPFADWTTVDFEALATLVEREAPSLIYIDHATCLYPMNLKEVIATVRRAAVKPIHVHVDTSHVNGLVWGGQIPNPLECGADTYGGSTHKTFPGPHKAVLFTNDPEVAERLTLTAVNTISHHHMSSVIALAIAMLEFDTCGGAHYAAQTLANAKAFARSLAEQGFNVQGRPPNYTESHQVWIGPPEGFTEHDASSLLFDAGLVVNPYNPLPSLGSGGIRMGVNEVTRLGLKETDMATLAGFVRPILSGGDEAASAARRVAELRRSFKLEYCFDQASFQRHLSQFCAAREGSAQDRLSALADVLYG